MSKSNIPTKNVLGVSILPDKQNVDGARFGPAPKFRLVTYSPLKGKYKVSSGITIVGNEVDTKDFNNKKNWTEMPLSNDIGLPLKFRMDSGQHSDTENMFAQIMTLKKDAKYYPTNTHVEPYYGSIIVVRVDGEALRSKDIQALWDLVHFQLCTMKALQDGNMLPSAFIQKHKRWAHAKEFAPWTKLAKEKLPDPTDPKFVRFDDEECWVSDRKYAFEFVREGWSDKKWFLDFWDNWSKGMVQDGFKDYGESELPCPVKKDSVCPTQ